MGIIKKFKDYFKKDDRSQAEKDYSSTMQKKGYRTTISFDVEALEEMEDKVRDIFFGLIEDSHSFDVEYQTTIEGAMMRLEFTFADFDQQKKAEIEKEALRGMKKLTVEFNSVERIVNVDNIGWDGFSNDPESSIIHLGGYMMYIWRYRQPGEPIR